MSKEVLVVGRNPNGSGISLGHPIGATGTLITVKALSGYMALRPPPSFTAGHRAALWPLANQRSRSLP
jgi:Thiolase, C-terminal domain